MTQAVALAQQASTGVSQGFKNRIINGAMVIDQRNAGASVTISTAGLYTLDRWVTAASQNSKFSVQQDAGTVTPPAGFTDYLGVTSLSAYSVGSTENFEIQQRIEGFNTADLSWGTANAKTVTFSFWVRSSLTGTFSGAITNSATNYSYVYSYPISAANTWEYKTITITGPTAGTWLTTNGIGVWITFSLGAGSSTVTTAGSWNAALYRGVSGQQQVVGTNGATFYITGVQLEVGSTATSFDYRPYGTELALCQRYYELCSWVPTTTNYYQSIYYKVNKRATPTLAQVSADGAVTVAVNSGREATFNFYQDGNASATTRATYSASAEL
jgi:hypothetical protein